MILYIIKYISSTAAPTAGLDAVIEGRSGTAGCDRPHQQRNREVRLETPWACGTRRRGLALSVVRRQNQSSVTLVVSLASRTACGVRHTVCGTGRTACGVACVCGVRHAVWHACAAHAHGFVRGSGRVPIGDDALPRRVARRLHGCVSPLVDRRSGPVKMRNTQRSRIYVEVVVRTRVGTRLRW